VDRGREKKDMKKKITVLAFCAMLFALCSSAPAPPMSKIFTLKNNSALLYAGDVVHNQNILGNPASR
jgi:PBP1b-binding outer membrane lipoprotein LpoB